MKTWAGAGLNFFATQPMMWLQLTRKGLPGRKTGA